MSGDDGSERGGDPGYLGGKARRERIVRARAPIAREPIARAPASPWPAESPAHAPAPPPYADEPGGAFGLAPGAHQPHPDAGWQGRWGWNRRPPPPQPPHHLPPSPSAAPQPPVNGWVRYRHAQSLPPAAWPAPQPSAPTSRPAGQWTQRTTVGTSSGAMAVFAIAFVLLLTGIVTLPFLPVMFIAAVIVWLVDVVQRSNRR